MLRRAVSLGLIVGAALAALAARAQAPIAWTEVAWPFLRDGWPNGRAFECAGGACGAKLLLTARVKNGFCDCSRGVADDDEIDRVGDVSLLTDQFKPLATSEAVPLAGMAGRTRLYETLDRGHRQVLSLAGGRDCNAFVAMALGGEAFPEGGAKAAAEFINTPAFSKWVAMKQVGG